MSLSFYQQLKKSLVKCPLGNQQFLPLSELDAKVTRDSISAQLSEDTRQLLPSLPDEVLDHAKKIFAILVVIGEPRRIQDLVQEGLTDEHLPLSLREADNYNVLKSRNDQNFKSFASWDNEPRVEEFLDKQWLVQAPVLDPTGRHIDLTEKCALPFLQSNKVATAADGLCSVHRGILHPAHQKGFEAKGAEIKLAIKEFQSKESFVKEDEILRQICDLKNEHIINLVATCKRESCYYIIFPWADGGNLRDFWKREDLMRNPELIIWSLRQMLRLAIALKALHSKNCRHGDLKPENILHFKGRGHPHDSREGILVVADVGVSRIHKEKTSLRHSQTNTVATTRSYEAPEALPGIKDPRSRVYDMWSLGCVFLEFTVWLLYGCRAVRSFRRSRKSTDPKIEDGTFFVRKSGGIADVHLTVSEAMDLLPKDPRCKGSTALGDLVKLIALNLLVANVSDRAEAGKLCEMLEKIVQDAERRPEYLLNRVDPPLETPLLFRPSGSRQNSAASNPETSQGLRSTAQPEENNIAP